MSSTFESYFDKAGKILCEVAKERRKRQRPRFLEDYEVDETLGEKGDPKDELKNAFDAVIRKIVAEMDRQFKVNNDVLQALAKCQNMSLEEMAPLAMLGIKLPSKSELATAKNYHMSQESKNPGSKLNVLTVLHPLREAFSDTYDLFCAVDTFGSSTAISESSFSCLSRIQTAKRISMSEVRLCHLSFLAFEIEYLKDISNEEILKKFFERNRKIL